MDSLYNVVTVDNRYAEWVYVYRGTADALVRVYVRYRATHGLAGWQWKPWHVDYRATVPTADDSLSHLTDDLASKGIEVTSHWHYCESCAHVSPRVSAWRECSEHTCGLNSEAWCDECITAYHAANSERES